MASIRKLPDGRWQAQCRPIPGGKQITRTTHRKVDAQRWLDEQSASVAGGRYVDASAGRITFKDYFELWAVRQIWVTETKRGITSTVHSAPFADVPLRLLTRSHLESWVKDMETTRRRHGKGQGTYSLAPSTIKTHFMRVRSILRAAVADKRLATDPSVGVKLPRGRRAEMAMQLPTIEQVRALISAADLTFRPFIAVCAFAGLRMGEACGLKIGDLDLVQGTLTVTRQIQQDARAHIEIRAPKYGSERKISIPDGLVRILSAHIAGLPGEVSPESWIFQGRDGRPYQRNGVHYGWNKAKTGAGVEGVRLHDLRHFFASALIAAGCDVVAVQRALGHANATMTLGTYAHLWPGAKDRIREAATSLFVDTLQSSDE